MDEHRYQELLAKRDTTGLSLEETRELGRMMAEQAGKPYSNARDLHESYDLDRGADPEAWSH